MQRPVSTYKFGDLIIQISDFSLGRYKDESLSIKGALDRGIRLQSVCGQELRRIPAADKMVDLAVVKRKRLQ